MDRAASSISDGDLVDSLIHGYVLQYLTTLLMIHTPIQTGTALVFDAVAFRVLFCETRIVRIRRYTELWWREFNLLPAVTGFAPYFLSIRLTLSIRWLGQNSKQNKLQRQLGDLQIRMRLKVSGNKAEIRQSYIPALFPHAVHPLMDRGAVCFL
jgi:replication factor C subunit 1